MAETLNDIRNAARLISRIERKDPVVRETIKRIYSRVGKATIIGVTGPPGVGKSTLVEKLGVAFRRQEHTVGVLAVDPTSPFSGGALLGDRVRMQALDGDPGVFIRSFATRGHLGGLAVGINEAIMVMEEAGAEVILLETVGVGQSEVEVMTLVQTCILVLSPGQGDGIQAMKAGVMEVADIFVINKSDLTGTEDTVQALRGALAMRSGGIDYLGSWDPPVICTAGHSGAGVAELVRNIQAHQGFLKAGPVRQSRRSQHARWELASAVRAELEDRLYQVVLRPEVEARYLEALEKRQCDPYTAAQEIVDALFDPVQGSNLRQ